MRILLLKTWLRNIGNGFIDKGASQIIKQSFPESEVIEVSGYPNMAERLQNSGELTGIPNIVNGFQDIKNEYRKRDNKNRAVNIADLIDDIDLVVFPGCILYKLGLETYSTVLERLNQDNVPIVFLGAGGGDYKDSTNRYVRKKFNEFRYTGLITRDSNAYDIYSEYADYSYNGIDCATFINDWYSPPNSTVEFVSTCFDKISEPELKTNKMKIRTTHTPFGYSKPFEGTARQIIDRHTNITAKKKEFFESDNIFLSDSLKDYLFIYNNTDLTYADRIHACIPTLAYGNKAQFEFDTPRGSLFSNITNKNISQKPITIERRKLEEKKEEQVSEFKNIVESLVDESVQR